MTQESIESLARKLAESLPQGLKNVRDDVEQNFRAVLQGGLSKLDLVSREEFDVQQAVLARTREKLEAMEARLQALELPAEAPATGRKKKAGKKRTSAKKAATDDQ